MHKGEEGATKWNERPNRRVDGLISTKEQMLSPVSKASPSGGMEEDTGKVKTHPVGPVLYGDNHTYKICLFSSQNACLACMVLESLKQVYTRPVSWYR